MKDDSISPETSNEDNDNGSEVAASLSSLEVHGAQPEVGDEVEIHVKGKVSRIEGDVAYISPTEVNGEPAPELPTGEDDDEGDERDQLMKKAEQSDASDMDSMSAIQ
jgi:hypothetical protein